MFNSLSLSKKGDFHCFRFSLVKPDWTQAALPLFLQELVGDRNFPGVIIDANIFSIDVKLYDAVMPVFIEHLKYSLTGLDSSDIDRIMAHANRKTIAVFEPAMEIKKVLTPATLSEKMMGVSLS